MKTVEIEVEMRNYIAHPYWPERDRCIEIEKKSGVNRQRSEEKRVAALKAECEKQGVTYDEYLELRDIAKKQWYTDKEGRIIIPRRQIAGMFVHTVGRSPKALRGPFDKDNFRAMVQIGHWTTDHTEPTGTFARFVKLDTSTQRSWQENDFLGQYLDEGQPFTAMGVIGIVDPKHEKTVKALLVEALEHVGVGASRKMGFGRGKLVSWKALS